MEQNTCWKRLQVGKIAMEITLDPFPLVFQKRRFDFSLCDRLKIKIWDRLFRILTRFFGIDSLGRFLAKITFLFLSHSTNILENEILIYRVGSMEEDTSWKRLEITLDLFLLVF